MPYTHLFDEFDARLVRFFQEEYEASGYGTSFIRVELPQKKTDSIRFGFAHSGGNIAFDRRRADRAMTDEELREHIRNGLMSFFRWDEYVASRKKKRK